jgi:hypothetical protein
MAATPYQTISATSCGGYFALPTEMFFSPIHLGLRDLSGSNERSDACVGQLIAVLAHAVFQTLRF